LIKKIRASFDLIDVRIKIKYNWILQYIKLLKKIVIIYSPKLILLRYSQLLLHIKVCKIKFIFHLYIIV